MPNPLVKRAKRNTIQKVYIYIRNGLSNMLQVMVHLQWGVPLTKCGVPW